MSSEYGARGTPDRGLVAAVFANRGRAEEALMDLRDQGFRPDTIGVAMRDAREARELAQSVTETEAEEGAAIGAVAGGALGGVAGWLVGIGALLIPGLGPIVAAGPLAVALGAAVLGAATGGLVGALVGEGIPEEHARWYEEAIRAGSVLVTVRAGDRADEARDILRGRGGVEAPERETGATPEARPQSEGTVLVGGEGPPVHPRGELAPEQPIVVPSPAPVTPPEAPAPTYHGPVPAAAQRSVAEREAVQPGWAVYGSDGVRLGTVQEVEAGRLRVDRGGPPPTVYVPLSAIRRAEHAEVYLDVPSDRFGEQGWQRIQRPAEQPKELRPMAQMRGTAREAMREMREGQPTEVAGDVLAFMESIPASTYFLAMVGSILGSLYLFVTGRKWESLFVGLWAPTFISAGMFYKLLHPSREMR